MLAITIATGDGGYVAHRTDRPYPHAQTAITQAVGSMLVGIEFDQKKAKQRGAKVSMRPMAVLQSVSGTTTGSRCELPPPVRGHPASSATSAEKLEPIVGAVGGYAIPLLDAQGGPLERSAGGDTLGEAPLAWEWQQDEQHCFVGNLHAVFGEQSPVGKALWDLGLETLGEVDWATHRQQREWRVDFHDLEIAHTDASGIVHYYSLSGEAVFDASDAFLGYRGIARDITECKRANPTT